MTWKKSLYRALAPLAAPFYAGMGSILLFHRVVESPPATRAGFPRGLEVAPALLEELFSRLRRAGARFVSMDALRDALCRGEPQEGRLVAVTFDDGFTDTFDLAFPLLTGLKIPFTVYLTTGFVDGQQVPWWVLLERCLTDGRLEGQEERDRAFDAMGAIFAEAPSARHRALAEEMFGPEEVARTIEAVCIRWDQVEVMARHPLVTIGAHTVSHPVLNALPADDAWTEMSESRRRIEARLGRPVKHFAYPYGSRLQVGAREFALARECGFATAVTTRLANVRPEHAAHLECLPRIYGESLRDLEIGMSGVVSAIRYRARRVVTV